MSEFWSIKEVASYLGVEYKTVYRLVRRGEIPAGKVGGVYRIRKSEVDAYFERQKQHIQQEAAEPDTPLKCAVCHRLIPDESEIAGKCAAVDCDAPICSSCWHVGNVRYCSEHRPSKTDKLGQAKAQLASNEIPLLVTALEAKQREMGFITRFDQKIHSIVEIRHPIEDKVLHPSLPWSGLHTYRDESDRLLDLLHTGYLDQDTKQGMPLNLISRYSIPTTQDRGGKLILEARVLSHLPALVRQGFDSRRATLTELLRVLESCIEIAETQETAYVIGVAATTGWKEEAKDYVKASGSGRSFSHRLVLPYLVDLHDITLIHNTADERLVPLASLFSPRSSEDRMAQVIDYVKQQLRLYNSLPFSEVIEQTKTDMETLQRAVERLVDAGGIYIGEVEGIGRVLSLREMEA